MAEVISDQARTLLIEKFLGDVDTQFVSTSILEGWLPVRPVKGTDTITVRRFGKSAIRSITDTNKANSPTTDEVRTDKITLSVTALLYMRNAFTKLGEVQQDINMTGESGRMHGREMAILYDTVGFIMAARGAISTVSDDLDGSFFDGISVELAAANDELDPDKVYDAIESIVTQMRERDTDMTGMRCFVTPATYAVLKDHPRLINKDYLMKSNGDYAMRMIAHVEGLPLIEVPGKRIPDTASTTYSDLFENAELEVTADMSDTIALIFGPESLLVGESLGLEADLFYEKYEKKWFVDTDRAYNLRVRNPGLCGSVRKYRL